MVKNVLGWWLKGILEKLGLKLQYISPDTFQHTSLVAPPTKVEVLEMAYNLAKKAGIWYPYVGKF